MFRRIAYTSFVKSQRGLNRVSLRSVTTGGDSTTASGAPIIHKNKEAEAQRLKQGKPPVVSKVMGVDEEYWNRPGSWDQKDLESLITANKAWANRKKSEGFFDDISKGHAPKILWIGCSDARVPANEIIGESAGNVFVHRNIANQVVNTDFNCMSVIQYAVDVLQVKHIIVCGHYDCGGVKAALTNMDHKPPLENWLRNIRDIHQHHFSELSAIADITSRQRRLVEISTIEQCLNIFKTGSVQRRRKQPFSEPVVHAMVYDPHTGKLKKLQVDFKEYMRTYSDVFNLYSVQDAQPISEIIRDSLVDEQALDDRT
eukprot:GSChrysophyteH1.ASY1.ANO1.1987.1 assembled CDS